MAVLKIPEENRTITDAGELREFLAARDIEYERMAPMPGSGADVSPDALLEAYAPMIEDLKTRGGYVVADVIDVKPETPNLDAMLKTFSSEHWHDEDEVRLIVEGRGLFHIHSKDGPVFALEVEAGDLIRVPKGTHHWFDLCGDRRIRAIRLFQDPSGWTPHYTESGVDSRFQPLCFGPSYIPVTRVRPGASA
jgi:1,2-dihydroxy-3-keto-5-methylthiopentene dioxygenase